MRPRTSPSSFVPIVAQKDLFYREVPEFPRLPSGVQNRIPPALRGAAEDAAGKQPLTVAFGGRYYAKGPSGAPE